MGEKVYTDTTAGWAYIHAQVYTEQSIKLQSGLLREASLYAKCNSVTFNLTHLLLLGYLLKGTRTIPHCWLNALRVLASQ